MLTQDDYRLYTGESPNFSDENWEKIVSMSAVRLAGLLCLESLPTDDKNNLSEEMKMLLANFICLMLAHRGSDDQIEEKRIRNFTIRYTNSATNSFAKLMQNYGDIIEKYSACSGGLCVENSTRYRCGCF